MPSLAVSGQGHALIGYNTAGTNEYINAAVSVRWAKDPLGALQTPQLFTASPAPYNPSSNSGNQQGRRRWGDYSFTSLDPCDDMTMWTIQQFGDAANSYGLRVAKIAAPPPATPAAASPQSIAADQSSVNVTITGQPPSNMGGAGFYDPGEGFNCRLRAAVTGGVVVNSVSYINPSTLSLNLSTANASAGMKTVIITNPDGQVATGTNLLTVGNCAYNVTANNQSFSATGGVGTISVETNNACGWTAISTASFISVNGAGTGSGTGTVSFTVAPTSGVARSGTLLVAGQAITIVQSAGEGCAYAISSPGKTFSSTGGVGSFNVITASECAWAATASDSFITVLFSSTRQGNGTVNFSVASSGQPGSRSGSIQVGGQTFTVTQGAPPFEITVDDGTFEGASDVTTGGTSSRVNRLTPTYYPATLNAVAIYFPDNGSVKPGNAFTVLTGVNADGDANIDGTLFQTTSAQVQELNAFTVVAVPSISIAQGGFVIGLQLNQSASTNPFALDMTKSKGRSYRSPDGVNFVTTDSLGVAGNYGIRARLDRPAKLIASVGASLAVESCQPANHVIDPGETVTVNLSLANNGANST